MHNVDLCRPADDIFFDSVSIGDVIYPINTDYRVILRILKIQGQSGYSQAAKNIASFELFFTDEFPPEPMKVLEWFIRCTDPPPEPSYEQPCTDYFFDGDAIYLSIKMQYGVDIIRAPYLHWFEFCMYLDGLNENTPLQGRIRTRTAKTEGLKGKDLLHLQRSKRRIALPDMSSSETQELLLQRFGME